MLSTYFLLSVLLYRYLSKVHHLPYASSPEPATATPDELAGEGRKEARDAMVQMITLIRYDIFIIGR